VIVDNLNVISIAGAPSETDAPMVVDPDAVLAGPTLRANCPVGRNKQIGSGSRDTIGKLEESAPSVNFWASDEYPFDRL
jgi:hypothetical protein